MSSRGGLALPLIILSALLAVALLWVITVGEVPIPGGDVLGVISGRVPASDPRSKIVLSIRLPRALAAASAGAVLAGSGVIFQGVLLNPLAEPYTLGVAAGAALGASAAITLGLPFISAFAFAGSIAALWLVWLLGRGSRGRASPSRLILAGVIVGSILGSVITLMEALAGEQVGAIVLWLLGSFSLSTWGHAARSAAMAAVVLALGLFWARDPISSPPAPTPPPWVSTSAEPPACSSWAAPGDGHGGLHERRHRLRGTRGAPPGEDRRRTGPPQACRWRAGPSPAPGGHGGPLLGELPWASSRPSSGPLFCFLSEEDEGPPLPEGVRVTLVQGRSSKIST